MKFHEHCASVAAKAAGVAHNFLKSTRCRSPDFMIHIRKTHIRPILEYASSARFGTAGMYTRSNKKVSSPQGAGQRDPPDASPSLRVRAAQQGVVAQVRSAGWAGQPAEAGHERGCSTNRRPPRARLMSS